MGLVVWGGIIAISINIFTKNIAIIVFIIKRVIFMNILIIIRDRLVTSTIYVIYIIFIWFSVIFIFIKFYSKI